jgi:ABC-type branched-subunit amino acid transport system ATPase component/ABC-type branched-subunit amino acid transport system permease subunit
VTGSVSLGSLVLSLDGAVLGALLGIGYGLLAVALVLVFRSSRVLNLAGVQVGTLASAVLARLVLDEGWSYWLALPVVVLLGAMIGAAIELVVVRRLAASPRVVLLVATIGVSQLLLVGEYALPDARHPGAPFPSPLHTAIDLPATVLGSPEVMVLALGPAVVAALALVMTRTPLGLAIRASAANRDAAALAGIPVGRVSTTVWALAGALAALTSVLLSALQGTTVSSPDAGISPGLLVRALAAALCGSLVSLPRALAGGVALGIIESTLRFSGAAPGTVDLFFFVAVLGLVLRLALRDRGSVDPDESVSLTLGPASRPVPAGLRYAWHLVGVACFAGVALLPVLIHNASTVFLLNRAVIFCLLALSVTVLTGWAGQLSLGQAALAGLGAMLTARLALSGVPFGAAVLLGALGGLVAGLVVAAPALLVRGALLATTTLAFAVMAESWLLQRDVFGGPQGLRVPGYANGRTDAQHWFWLCLTVVTVVAVLVDRSRRTGIGRRIIAARANPRRAASLTVGTRGARLVAFGLSGLLAGLAGGLFTGLSGSVDHSRFPVFDSLLAVAVVAVGGFGSVGGALGGTALLVGVPALFGNSLVSLVAAVGLGLTVVVLYLPGGLAALARTLRDAAHDVLARTAAPPSPPSRAAQASATAASPRSPARTATIGEVLLEARALVVTFGGRRAVDGVDLVVRDQEVLGLIGANGAGKSTLLDALSGFTPIGSGQVGLGGWDITRLPAHRRAAMGVGRVFQDARLFGDLSVLETVMLALESGAPTDLVPAVLALPPSWVGERAKRVRATEVIDALGLGALAPIAVSRLSTGTRRVVEIACLTAQGARVLLLDEPTAGLAQREAEAFAPLLLRLRDDLAATVVLVEHDIPLVSAVSDRVQCLGAGRTLAVGGVAEVLADPAVIASYLGTDDRAVARSGALVG